MLNNQTAFNIYQKTKALGEVAIASEFTLVLDDAPDLMYLVKQFPVPTGITPEDMIEVPMVGGMKGSTAQMDRYDVRGTIAFKETVDGKVRKFLENLQSGERTVANRPRFNGTVYLGTPEDHTQKWRIHDACLFGFDPFDADTENRSSLAVYQGQIFYMYFPGVE